ncbi:MAG: TraE/TraK family type IV conjugative transfer system protein [Thermodesulfobacteriota bacterium]
MHIKKFINKFDNLTAENRLLKFVIIVIGAGCIISSAISLRAVTYQKVVILPPAVDKRIVIQGSSVNTEYIELFTKYAMGLLLNYTPGIFDDQISDLLKLTSPRYYPALNRRMLEIKGDVKRLSITSMFYPQLLRINQEKQEINILGLRIQTARGQEVERVEKIYLMKYQLLNGRFYVDGIEEVEKQ